MQSAMLDPIQAPHTPDDASLHRGVEIGPIAAFERFGIEVEYAIVGTGDLECRSIADIILATAAGPGTVTTGRGLIGWSNEFVLHVLEAKNLIPAARLEDLVEPLQCEVAALNKALLNHEACLMPTAMHPWMDPRCDARAWPIDPHGIYRAYQRIFETRSHGWTNLQSLHLNLPFAGDDQFARLHEAIRRVLPIIPALAASSPIADGQRTAHRDSRMQAYRANAKAYPLINGLIVPDSVSSQREYESRILEPIYAAMAPADPDGILRQPWLNARGCIPRFDRNTIEIRVIDTQECPEVDLAVAAAVIGAVHRLYGDPQRLSDDMSTEELARIFDSCVMLAEDAMIDDRIYLTLFDYPGYVCRAGDLWRHILENLDDSLVIDPLRWRPIWAAIMKHGSLAHRIEDAVGANPSRERLATVYRRLCDCLQQGSMFIPDECR